MPITFTYALTSTLILTVLASFVVKIVPVKHPHIKTILSYLSALAAGSLLGDAFLYLIPKATDNGWTVTTALFILAGILVVFITEQMITWQETQRQVRHSRKHHAAISNMIGFTGQSFLDGLVIASAYGLSISMGIATFIAVLFHQIPQEISNFVILRRAGIPIKLSNRINTLAVFACFVGAFLALLIPVIAHDQVLIYSAPFTAGVFIYIALADLMPDILIERSVGRSINQILLIIVGIGIIAGVKYFKVILGGLD